MGLLHRICAIYSESWRDYCTASAPMGPIQDDSIDSAFSVTVLRSIIVLLVLLTYFFNINTLG